MPKPSVKRPQNVQLTVRVTDAVVARLDKLVDVSTETSGRVSVRTDVHREALLLGISAMEERLRTKDKI